VAPREGLEPPTRGLEIRCSIRLSYRGARRKILDRAIAASASSAALPPNAGSGIGTVVVVFAASLELRIARGAGSTESGATAPGGAANPGVATRKRAGVAVATQAAPSAATVQQSVRMGFIGAVCRASALPQRAFEIRAPSH
jgi:hypothetical protein